MYLCIASKRRTGPRVAKRWWEQEGLYLVGMRTAAWNAEQMEGDEETDGTGTETDN